jgi:hypothetical protein
MTKDTVGKTLAMIVIAMLGVGCSDNNESAVGGERQPCFPNLTCNPGLVCLSDVCVRQSDGGQLDGPTVDGPKADGPKVDGPTVDGPKVDGPKVDGPKVDGPKVDGPKVDGPKVDGPKVDALAKDQGRTDALGGDAFVADWGLVQQTTIKAIKTNPQPVGLVSLKGVVVTAVDDFGTVNGDVYVQDPAGGQDSGIQLLRPRLDSGAAITSLQPGDRVDVFGDAIQFAGPTSNPFANIVVPQIRNAVIVKRSSGLPLAPTTISAQTLQDENTAQHYDAMLVELVDRWVLSDNDQFGEFRLQGDVKIDDDLYQHLASAGQCLTVRGIVRYFYRHRVNPRAAADVVTSTSCPAASAVTPSQIQNPLSPNRPAAGDLVKVSGVVTAVDQHPSSSGLYIGFWIQEPGAGGPYKGIYIFAQWKSSDTLKPPALGNAVEVTGIYSEYFGLSEVEHVIAIADKGPSSQLSPVEVLASDIEKGAANQQQYEGVLIRVRNVKVRSLIQNIGGTVTYGFAVEGADFEIKDDLYDFTPAAAGTTYSSITGVLHAFKSQAIQLLPRSASDLVQ